MRFCLEAEANRPAVHYPATALRVAIAILVLAVTAYLLQSLAQHQLGAYLRASAAHALALNAKGQTPYRWSFRTNEDLVAGRVFGARDFSFRDDGIEIASAGSAFEIGLPLSRPLDLRRFPNLYIDTAVDAAAIAHIVIRETLDAREVISVPLALSKGRNAFDLSALAWDGATPSRAAMLRLRVELPNRSALRLHDAALERIAGARRIDLTQSPALTDISSLDPAALRAVNEHTDPRVTPLFALDQSQRVEPQLLQLKAVQASAPGAIVIPRQGERAVFRDAMRYAESDENPTGAAFVRWSISLLFVLILALVRWRAPSNMRARALLEILLVLAAPLWLIAGGQFTGNMDRTQALLVAATAVYAISLGWPRSWSWNGSTRAWLFAAAVVVLAATIGLALHTDNAPLRTISAGHVLRYLGWALVQQYLICVVCLERWRIAAGNRIVAIYLGALGFALLHTPNAALMLATLIGGLCWCTLYMRERAILPLAVSHAASALLLIALLPPDVLLSAEVSARFFQ